MGCGSSVSDTEKSGERQINNNSTDDDSEVFSGMKITPLWIPTNTNPGKLFFKAQDGVGKDIVVAVDSMFGTVHIEDQTFTLDAEYEKSIFASDFSIGSTTIGLWGPINDFQREEIPPVSLSFRTQTELAQFLSVTTAIRHGIGSAPGDLHHKPILRNQGNTRSHEVRVVSFVCGDTFNEEFTNIEDTQIIILLILKKEIDIDSMLPSYDAIIDCSADAGTRLVILVHSNSIQKAIRVKSNVITDVVTGSQSVRAAFKYFDTSICVHAINDLTMLPSVLCNTSNLLGSDFDDDFLCNYAFAIGQSPFTTIKPSVNTLQLLSTDNWSDEVPNDPLFPILKLDAMSFRELGSHTSKPVYEVISDPMSSLGWPYRILVSSNKKGLQAIKYEKYEVFGSHCRGAYTIQVTEPCLHRCVVSTDLIPKLHITMELTHLPISPAEAELVLRSSFFPEIVVSATQLSKPLVIDSKFGTPAFIATQTIHILLRSKSDGPLAQGLMTLSSRRTNESPFTIDLCKYQRRACTLQGRIRMSVSSQAAVP